MSINYDGARGSSVGSTPQQDDKFKKIQGHIKFLKTQYNKTTKDQSGAIPSIGQGGAIGSPVGDASQRRSIAQGGARGSPVGDASQRRSIGQGGARDSPVGDASQRRSIGQGGARDSPVGDAIPRLQSVHKSDVNVSQEKTVEDYIKFFEENQISIPVHIDLQEMRRTINWLNNKMKDQDKSQKKQTVLGVQDFFLKKVLRLSPEKFNKFIRTFAPSLVQVIDQDVKDSQQQATNVLPQIHKRLSSHNIPITQEIESIQTLLKNLKIIHTPDQTLSPQQKFQRILRLCKLDKTYDSKSDVQKGIKMLPTYIQAYKKKADAVRIWKKTQQLIRAQQLRQQMLSSFTDRSDLKNFILQVRKYRKNEKFWEPNYIMNPEKIQILEKTFSQPFPPDAFQKRNKQIEAQFNEFQKMSSIPPTLSNVTDNLHLLNFMVENECLIMLSYMDKWKTVVELIIHDFQENVGDYRKEFFHFWLEEIIPMICQIVKNIQLHIEPGVEVMETGLPDPVHSFISHMVLWPILGLMMVLQICNIGIVFLSSQKIRNNSSPIIEFFLLHKSSARINASDIMEFRIIFLECSNIFFVLQKDDNCTMTYRSMLELERSHSDLQLRKTKTLNLPSDLKQQLMQHFLDSQGVFSIWINSSFDIANLVLIIFLSMNFAQIMYQSLPSVKKSSKIFVQWLFQFLIMEDQMEQDYRRSERYSEGKTSLQKLMDDIRTDVTHAFSALYRKIFINNEQPTHIDTNYQFSRFVLWILWRMYDFYQNIFKQVVMINTSFSMDYIDSEPLDNVWLNIYRRIIKGLFDITSTGRQHQQAPASTGRHHQQAQASASTFYLWEKSFMETYRTILEDLTNYDSMSENKGPMMLFTNLQKIFRAQQDLSQKLPIHIDLFHDKIQTVMYIVKINQMKNKTIQSDSGKSILRTLVPDFFVDEGDDCSDIFPSKDDENEFNSIVDIVLQYQLFISPEKKFQSMQQISSYIDKYLGKQGFYRFCAYITDDQLTTFIGLVKNQAEKRIKQKDIISAFTSIRFRARRRIQNKKHVRMINRSPLIPVYTDFITFVKTTDILSELYNIITQSPMEDPQLYCLKNCVNHEINGIYVLIDNNDRIVKQNKSKDGSILYSVAHKLPLENNPQHQNMRFEDKCTAWPVVSNEAKQDIPLERHLQLNRIFKIHGAIQNVNKTLLSMLESACTPDMIEEEIYRLEDLKLIWTIYTSEDFEFMKRVSDVMEKHPSIQDLNESQIEEIKKQFFPLNKKSISRQKFQQLNFHIENSDILKDFQKIILETFQPLFYIRQLVQQGIRFLTIPGSVRTPQTRKQGTRQRQFRSDILQRYVLPKLIRLYGMLPSSSTIFIIDTLNIFKRLDPDFQTISLGDDRFNTTLINLLEKDNVRPHLRGIIQRQTQQSLPPSLQSRCQWIYIFPTVHSKVSVDKLLTLHTDREDRQVYYVHLQYSKLQLDFDRSMDDAVYLFFCNMVQTIRQSASVTQQSGIMDPSQFIQKWRRCNELSPTELQQVWNFLKSIQNTFKVVTDDQHRDWTRISGGHVCQIVPWSTIRRTSRIQHISVVSPPDEQT